MASRRSGASSSERLTTSVFDQGVEAVEVDEDEAAELVVRQASFEDELADVAR